MAQAWALGAFLALTQSKPWPVGSTCGQRVASKRPAQCGAGVADAPDEHPPATRRWDRARVFSAFKDCAGVFPQRVWLGHGVVGSAVSFEVDIVGASAAFSKVQPGRLSQTADIWDRFPPK